MSHPVLLSAALLLAAMAPACAAAPADTARTHSLDQVVVTGSNHATPARLLPYTVSVVSRQAIEATGKTQLLAALTGQVPSLFVSQRNIFGFGVSNGGSGAIKIRGVGGSPTNAVLMMVDGQPQFAGLYGHPVADFYESEYVDHVEVLRGPGTVLYGSNAMGGVINVITREPRRQGLHVALTSQYGSYNTWQNSLTAMLRQGRWTGLFSAGYDRTDGLQDHFDFRQKSAYAKVGYQLTDNWALAADYALMGFVGNDPVYAPLSHPGSTDIYHQNVVRGETSLTLSDHYAHTDGALRVYYNYGNHFIDDPRHFHSLDDRFGVLGYQNFRPWRSGVATVGFDFARYTGCIPMSGGHAHGDGSQQAAMQTLSRQFIGEYSPYVSLQQHLWDGHLVLNGGLRMANSNRFGTHWMPQVGLTAHPADAWTVKASLARGYRNPSFRELYLYAVANPELAPESMINYEATMAHTFSRYLSVDLTAYLAKGSNLIEVAAVPTADGGVRNRNMNTGRFINRGIELTARSQVSDALALRASYSYLRSSVTTLTAAPRTQYFVGAAWQPVPQLTVDAQLQGVGALYVAGDVPHQNYALLGLRVGYRPVSLVELFATLDNLTNAHYTINRGYQMPGFTAMGGFKVRW